jgi:hypothetical protein
MPHINYIKNIKRVKKEIIKENIMTSKDIKLLAGNIVFESEYSDFAKKQLLNFIANEATDHQIKTLILDGNIETIAEDAENIVDKRFDIVTDGAVSEIVEDTVAFLTIGRETICEFIESQGYEEDQLNEMNNFIMNETTDYQIMSMLTDDVLPDEDSNPMVETMLFESLNMATGTNFIPLSEYGISSILNEDTMSHKQALGGKIIHNTELGAKKGAEIAAKIRDRAIHGVDIGAKKGKEYAGAAKEKISGVLKNLPSASAIGAKIADAATSPAGMAIGGLAAATLLGYGAYKIYKNYFSVAAKKCAGSPDKAVCMKQARMAGVKAQIADLNKGASACSKSKDPAKCKIAIQSKIAKLRNKTA